MFEDFHGGKVLRRYEHYEEKLKKASAGKGWPRVNCERWEEFGQVRKNEVGGVRVRNMNGWVI